MLVAGGLGGKNLRDAKKSPVSLTENVKKKKVFAYMAYFLFKLGKLAILHFLSFSRLKVQKAGKWWEQSAGLGMWKMFLSSAARNSGGINPLL